MIKRLWPVAAFLIFLCFCSVLKAQISGTGGGGISKWRHTHATWDKVGQILSDMRLDIIAAGSTDTIKVNLSPTGDIYASGTIYAGTAIFASGPIYATGDITAINATFTKSVAIGHDLDVDHNINVDGDAQVDGTLNSDYEITAGDGYLAGGVTITAVGEVEAGSHVYAVTNIESSTGHIMAQSGQVYGAEGVGLDHGYALNLDYGTGTHQILSATAGIDIWMAASDSLRLLYSMAPGWVLGMDDSSASGSLVIGNDLSVSPGNLINLDYPVNMVNLTTAGATVTASVGFTANGSIQALAGDVTTSSEFRMPQSGRLVMNSSTDTAYMTFLGSTTTISTPLTVVGGLETMTGDASIDGDILIPQLSKIYLDAGTNSVYFTTGGATTTLSNALTTLGGIETMGGGDIYSSGDIISGGFVGAATSFSVAGTEFVDINRVASFSSGTVTNGATFGGGYDGGSGCDIQGDGDVYCSGNLLVDGTITGTLSATPTLQQVTDTGNTTTKEIQTTASLYSTGTVYTDADFDGVNAQLTGYASAAQGFYVGATHVIDASTVATFSSATITNSVQIGGGYGSTGIDLQADGDIFMNGKLTVDGDIDPVNIDYSGALTGGTASFSSGTVTNNWDVTGDVFANAYHGDGSALTGITATLDSVLTAGASSTLGLTTGDHEITGGDLIFDTATGTVCFNDAHGCNVFAGGVMNPNFIGALTTFPFLEASNLYIRSFAGVNYEAGIVVGTVTGKATGLRIMMGPATSDLKQMVTYVNGTANNVMWADGRLEINLDTTITSGDSITAHNDGDYAGINIDNRVAAPAGGAQLRLNTVNTADGGGMGRILFSQGIVDDVSINVKRVNANNNRMYINVEQAGVANSMLELDGANDRVEVGTSSDDVNMLVYGSFEATGTASATSYIASNIAGISYSQTVCCTWDDTPACTATGTVTFTGGILTAETCP